ncbi:hypothetical protein, partial [Azohydromonas lata]
SARLHAASTVTMGNVSAGNVSVVADTGAIANAAGSTRNVSATNLRLQAGGAIGTAARHLTLAVSTLSARGAGVFVDEADALTVGNVGVSVTELGAGTATTVVSDAAQSDLVSLNNGHIVLVAGGTVTLNDGTANGGSAGVAGTAVSAAGTGSILVQATSGDVIVNSDIASGTGHVTLKAAGSVLLGSATATGVDVSTAGTGTVSIDARSGVLAMAGDAKVAGASARLHAASTVTVGNVSAGNVSVVADTGAIANAAGSTKNVSATNLRLQAGGALGTAA